MSMIFYAFGILLFVAVVLCVEGIYLWWNNTTGKKFPGCPKDAYAALGKFANNMLIVPSLDLIVIRQIGEDPQANRKFDMNATLQGTQHMQMNTTFTGKRLGNCK